MYTSKKQFQVPIWNQNFKVRISLDLVMLFFEIIQLSTVSWQASCSEWV